VRLADRLYRLRCFLFGEPPGPDYYFDDPDVTARLQALMEQEWREWNHPFNRMIRDRQAVIVEGFKRAGVDVGFDDPHPWAARDTARREG
jgi:hypothetical protein